MGAQAMRKSEQESETEEQYEVRWRLDKDAAKEEDRGEVDSGVRNADGDGTVGLISSGAHSSGGGGIFQSHPLSRNCSAQGGWLQRGNLPHATSSG